MFYSSKNRILKAVDENAYAVNAISSTVLRNRIIEITEQRKRTDRLFDEVMRKFLEVKK